MYSYYVIADDVYSVYISPYIDNGNWKRHAAYPPPAIYDESDFNYDELIIKLKNINFVI